MGANVTTFSPGHGSSIFGKRKRTIRNAHLDASSRHLQHPRSIEDIVKCTRFSKAEIRLLYRSFKQECPSGNINEERLRGIYLQFFPQGNAGKYARYLFSVIDRNHKGTFTFDDYIITLSVLCRGTIEEKLRWIFRFYDIHGEGILTRENLGEIIVAIYELLGPAVQPVFDENDIQKHTEEVYNCLDPMRSQQITVDEFVEFCKRKPQLLESIDELSCCL